jgi:hypothetical protein
MMWFLLEIRALAFQCTEERRRSHDKDNPNVRNSNYATG